MVQLRRRGRRNGSIADDDGDDDLEVVRARLWSRLQTIMRLLSDGFVRMGGGDVGEEEVEA